MSKSKSATKPAALKITQYESLAEAAKKHGVTVKPLPSREIEEIKQKCLGVLEEYGKGTLNHLIAMDQLGLIATLEARDADVAALTVEMRRLRAVDSAVEKWRANGRANGYPECCIDYFCTIWHSKVDRGELKVVRAYAELVRQAGFQPGYIPCPKCLAKRLET